MSKVNRSIVGLFPFIHSVIVLALLFLFTWPAATAEPRDVPIGIVAPSPLGAQVAETLDSKQPGAFQATLFSDVEVADKAIADREIYGALVLGEQVQVRIASGASPAVAELITSLGRGFLNSNLAKQGLMMPEVQVTELAYLPEADPRGMIFGTSTLPVLIGGISLGAIVALRVRGKLAQLGVLVASSLLTAAGLAWALTEILGAIEGSFTATWGVLALTLAAIAFPLVAAHRLFGMRGFGLIAATFFLIGNPLSGVSIPKEFYLSIWGQVGQSLPLGAGFDALRSTAYFDGAGVSGSLWVLGTYVAVAIFAWFLKPRYGVKSI